VDWLDPTTYQLLNWIVLGSALCVILIFTLCVLRCCCICCKCCGAEDGKKKRYGHRKVDSSQPLFQQASISRDTKTDNAFQTDLNNAIELHKRGKKLKTSKRDVLKQATSNSNEQSLDLDENQISAAFDMNFDEVSPMKKDSHNLKVSKHVVAQDSADMEAEAAVISNGNRKGSNANSKRKKSESKRKKSSSKERGRQSLFAETPGGPSTSTPGGPDDDDNPPPAPAAPTGMSREEAEAAYDLL